jgi:hypothetical protein
MLIPHEFVRKANGQRTTKPNKALALALASVTQLRQLGFFSMGCIGSHEVEEGQAAGAIDVPNNRPKIGASNSGTTIKLALLGTKGHGGTSFRSI